MLAPACSGVVPSAGAAPASRQEAARLFHLQHDRTKAMVMIHKALMKIREEALLLPRSFLALPPVSMEIMLKTNPKLATCHPVLQEMALYIHQRQPIRVFTCHRSRAEQRKKKAEGRSTLEVGKHNSVPSMAIDMVPYSGRGPIKWDDFTALYTMNGHAYGFMASKGAEFYKGFKLRFGAEWLVPRDPFHIELRGEPKKKVDKPKRPR